MIPSHYSSSGGYPHVVAPGITARLIGGLGNQLFGYYAAAALAAHHEVELRIDTSWSTPAITGHSSVIRDFDLPGIWLPDERFANRLAPPRSLRRRVINKVVGEVSPLWGISGLYRSPVVGHDPDLFRQQPHATLWGFFQSWSTVQSAVDAGYSRRPALRSPSAFLDSLIIRAHRERPISVHVRRGDYVREPSFGLLGMGYYSAAVDALRERGLTGPVWVFSDEPTTAAEVVAGEIITGLTTPAEEMVLMSHCAAHIVANSTFSWWGAWMNDGNVPVIAPEPWFRDGPHIEGLIPPHWTRLAASFVSGS